MTRRASGLLPQGTTEEIYYRSNLVRLAAKYGTPTAVGACHLYDETLDNLDVSATCLTGTGSLVGVVHTSPLVHSLEGHRYILVPSVVFPLQPLVSWRIPIKGEL